MASRTRGDDISLVSGDKQFAGAFQSSRPDVRLFGSRGLASREAGDEGRDLLADHRDGGLVGNDMVQADNAVDGVEAPLVPQRLTVAWPFAPASSAMLTAQEARRLITAPFFILIMPTARSSTS